MHSDTEENGFESDFMPSRSVMIVAGLITRGSELMPSRWRAVRRTAINGCDRCYETTDQGAEQNSPEERNKLNECLGLNVVLNNFTKQELIETVQCAFL